VGYSNAKANYKQLEIRNGEDGSILFKIKRITPYKCGYNAEMLQHTGDQTTLTPWEIVYAPDGSKIAVWYYNHGPNLDCQAIELEELLIIDAHSGAIEAVREGFIWDFWTKNGEKVEIECGNFFPMAFDPTGKFLYVADCSAKLIKYDISGLKPLKKVDFFDQVDKIITVDLNQDLIRKRFPFDELFCQPDGSLLTTYGGQGVGWIFRIEPDLSNIKFITSNQGSVYANISYSPNHRMVMFNSKAINIYDLNHKKPVFYQTTAGLQVKMPVFTQQNRRFCMDGTIILR
ncbi:MAG: WD40 repeat domain-containing protein, partial [Chloroflexia bacterium]|nr:WD40 repeat domain-containing protein [Chloroflexia bacterium]